MSRSVHGARTTLERTRLGNRLQPCLYAHILTGNMRIDCGPRHQLVHLSYVFFIDALQLLIVILSRHLAFLNHGLKVETVILLKLVHRFESADGMRIPIAAQLRGASRHLLPVAAVLTVRIDVWNTTAPRLPLPLHFLVLLHDVGVCILWCLPVLRAAH